MGAEGVSVRFDYKHLASPIHFVSYDVRSDVAQIVDAGEASSAVSIHVAALQEAAIRTESTTIDIRL